MGEKVKFEDSELKGGEVMGDEVNGEEEKYNQRKRAKGRRPRGKERRGKGRRVDSLFVHQIVGRRKGEVCYDAQGRGGGMNTGFR